LTIIEYFKNFKISKERVNYIRHLCCTPLGPLRTHPRRSFQHFPEWIVLKKMDGKRMEWNGMEKVINKFENREHRAVNPNLIRRF